MIRFGRHFLIPGFLLAFVLVSVGLSSALQHAKAYAQSAPTAKTCNILMIMDRSGSVSDVPTNKQDIATGIESFYDPTKLLRSDIKTSNGQININFGFWSFSASSDISPTTKEAYDSPYMNYEDITQPKSLQDFISSYSPIDESGGTDYEQAFAYNGFVFNKQTINPDTTIQSMIKNANVLAFMTDGIPNTPVDIGVNGDDNNPGAIKAAKSAYNAMVKLNTINGKSDISTYKHAYIYAGPGANTLTGTDTDSSTLDYIFNNYALPGDDPNDPNIVPNKINIATGQGKRYNNNHSASDISYITTDYGTAISSQMASDVTNLCNQETGVSLGDPYNLSPTISKTDSSDAAAGTVTANFNYSVDSSLPSGSKTDDSTPWRIESLVVPPGQTAQNLAFGTQYTDSTGKPISTCGYNANASQNVSYCDGIVDCTQLYPLIGGTGVGQSGVKRSCTDAATSNGSQLFPHGSTTLDAGAAATATLNSNYPIGTKLCYVLILHKPTRDASPLDRASAASCITVGKKPSVQVHGGDLRVGASFPGVATPSDGSNGTDSTNSQTAASIIDTSTTAKNGSVYGSWVEYAASAPGTISGFGSKSGLAGGYTTADPTNQLPWSKLTFGNAQNQYGLFTSSNAGQGTIPDYASTIVATVGDKSGTTPLTDSQLTLTSGKNPSTVYQPNGDITINTSTLGAGESIVVDAPNNKVTIAGNITYDNGPYSDISQIPQLVIIAQNITIDASVNTVDAWLIAGTATDSTIATCDISSGLTITICNQPLTINGPVIAGHLNLLRTGGSGDDNDPTSPDAASAAAETIDLSGWTYLWSQGQGASNQRALTTYSTEKPPYF